MNVQRIYYLKQVLLSKLENLATRKRLEKCGEREIVYNVYKFVRNETNVSKTTPLSKVLMIAPQATGVSRKNLFRLMIEGKNVKNVAAIAFSNTRKRRTKIFHTEFILDNSDEAVLRRTVHKFYLNEKQRQTLKAIYSKMCESTGFGGGTT